MINAQELYSFVTIPNEEIKKNEREYAVMWNKMIIECENYFRSKIDCIKCYDNKDMSCSNSAHSEENEIVKFDKDELHEIKTLLDHKV